MEPLTVPPVTTRAAIRDETVSSGNGIGATALATLLHERCQEDWQRRFDNGARAITMHDVSAHDETARWLAARGVTVGLDVERLAAALEEAAGYTSPASHGRPAREKYRLWLHGALHDIESIASAYAATPAQPATGPAQSGADGVHIGCDTDLAYEAGREDGTHEATLAAAHVVERQGLALGRLREAAQAVVEAQRCMTEAPWLDVLDEAEIDIHAAIDALRAVLEEAPRG